MDSKQPHGGLLLSLGGSVSECQLTLVLLGLGSLQDIETMVDQLLANVVA